MNAFALLLLAVTAFLPPLVGYGRCLGHWSMMRIWLWMLLPVAGWCVALYLAATSPD